MEDALDVFPDFLSKEPTTYVVAMNTFANDLTLAFLKFYQDKGSEAIYRGVRMLQESKHVAFVITSCKKARALANQASKLQKPNISLYHSTKFDIFKELCQELIRAKLLALRPEDLLIIIKDQHAWDKIADCYVLNLSLAVKTYIEVEYQRYLSAKYFPEILCSLIASTRATLELFSIDDTEKVNRKEVSRAIKNTKKKIKSADVELIVNALDISPNEVKFLSKTLYALYR
ncbi:45659_t:CDS:2 [Gigaspora margarita]|uniref:45659_t:CDS:1 n=1 Tax=Gigaspora margarita TaxID=4874 RepID=A0ABN7W6D9_GIGMA|nr:45659_t:CDS:2 [Gigaspora margarita]